MEIIRHDIRLVRLRSVLETVRDRPGVDDSYEIRLLSTLSPVVFFSVRNFFIFLTVSPKWKIPRTWLGFNCGSKLESVQNNIKL